MKIDSAQHDSFFLFVFSCISLWNFVSAGSIFFFLEEAKNKTREEKKRFKIISSSRSTYTNIIYLHVALWLQSSFVSCCSGLFASPVYILLIYLCLWTSFLTRIYPNDVKTKRARTLKRCQGLHTTRPLSIFSTILCRKLWPRKVKRSKKKSLVNESKSFS